MIQAMWKAYIEANPTNHPGERKAKRLAFYAGAGAMLDHQRHAERLSDEFTRNQAKATLRIVGGDDE